MASGSPLRPAMTRKSTIASIMMDDSEFNAHVEQPGVLKKVAEGKTKVIFEIDGYPEQVVIHSKDRITAFNAVRSDNVEGKASLSNMTTCKVFAYLQALGMKTHFIKKLNETDFVAERCAMIPLEWIARRVATGSFLKRNPGVTEGYRFSPPKIEISFKDDANNDPFWSEEMTIEKKMVISGISIGAREVEHMSRTTRLVFELLERAWSLLDCSLIDMKIEFGVNFDGDIVVADVIDNDSWRLWPSGDKRLQLDKQFYRDAAQVDESILKQLKTNYQKVADMLDKFITPPRGRVVILMGSEADADFCRKIMDAVEQYRLPCEMRVTSAHKNPLGTLKILAEYDGDGIRTVYICVAGRSNGLGPVTAGATKSPVINCPPISSDWGREDVWSSLRLPSGLGCSVVLDPASAALCAATQIGLFDHIVWGRLKVNEFNQSFVNLVKGDRRLAVENKQRDEELRRSISTTSQLMQNGSGSFS